MDYFSVGGKGAHLAGHAVIKPHTDGDRLSDGDEILRYFTDPNKVDSDGDGLSDYDEVKVYRTDPLNPDTDGDKLIDGEDP